MPTKYQITKKNLLKDRNNHKTTNMIKKNTHGQYLKMTEINSKNKKWPK